MKYFGENINHMYKNLQIITGKERIKKKYAICNLLDGNSGEIKGVKT
ncbi:hypothetical protein PHEL85_0286 [Polaribacter sp. Hel1_85]|nr:hypothetical protein PHEL85_0286 [Polaribacter sp. Hel1_85]